MPAIPPRHYGFTLAELAIVLIIVGLLLGGLMVPLAAQDRLRRTEETRKALETARDALIGYALAQQRLPCPGWDGSWSNDPADSHGGEYFASGGTSGNGRCQDFYRGLVPARTLGIGPVDDHGFLIDGWGRPIRYAIAKSNQTSPVFTQNRGIADTYRTSGDLPGAELKICTSAIGATASDCANAALQLADGPIAILYSLGANAGQNSEDERQNPNTTEPGQPGFLTPDPVFVSHELMSATAPAGEFDDLMIWLSPNILYYRLLAAGRLP